MKTAIVFQEIAGKKRILENIRVEFSDSQGKVTANFQELTFSMDVILDAKKATLKSFLKKLKKIGDRLPKSAFEWMPQEYRQLEPTLSSIGDPKDCGDFYRIHLEYRAAKVQKSPIKSGKGRIRA